jgi:hypothetical protein
VSSDEPDDVRLRVSFRANYQAVIAEVWKLNGTRRAVDFVKHRRKLAHSYQIIEMNGAKS